VTLDPSWSRPRAYPVTSGAVSTHSLEAHVVDHCNLRCAGCCVLSPLAPRRLLEPEALARDLAWARAVLRPSIFKLTGGEPLLSPRIVDLARVAKASGIAPVVSLTTNGLLAARASDALLDLLDAITVSIYPGAGIDEAALGALRERALRHGVSLNEKRQDDFQAMTRPSPVPSSGPEARAVFEGCWLRHRCHTLRGGRLYACSRPPSVDAFVGAGGAIVASDGLSLEPRSGLADEVRAYLERAEPLASCGHCLGGTGALFPYRLLSRQDLLARRPE